MTDATLAEVKLAIQTYLATRKSACDTAKGIRDWWLCEMNINASVETTIRALAELEREGLMRCIVVPGGAKVWAAT